MKRSAFPLVRDADFGVFAVLPPDNTIPWWIAEGIPITPYDDAGKKYHYPLMKVTAKRAAGAVFACTNIVLPVSDEMDTAALSAHG